MTVLTVIPIPADEDCDLGVGYDYSRLPEEIRVQAMTAEGTIVQGLRSAVQRVLEAGQVLMWAKETLPHGEYLPWVQQACGLKPQYASQLIKAAEWMSNIGQVQHLESITDAKVLFLLSADTTPDQVRDWFLERCAAGAPPTRKEVQERKRNATPGGRERTMLQEALSALRLSPEARELAAKAEHISTRRLMEELDVEELPKGRQHQTAKATYCKNGNGWWRFPVGKPAPDPMPQHQAFAAPAEQHLTIEQASKLFGYRNPKVLSTRLSPANIKERGYPKQNGWVARPSTQRGMCFVERIGL